MKVIVLDQEIAIKIERSLINSFVDLFSSFLGVLPPRPRQSHATEGINGEIGDSHLFSP